MGPIGGLKPIQPPLPCRRGKVGVNSEMATVCVPSPSSSLRIAGFCRKYPSLSSSLRDVIIRALKKEKRLSRPVFPAFGDQPGGQPVPGSPGKGRVPWKLLATRQPLLVHHLLVWIRTQPGGASPWGHPGGLGLGWGLGCSVRKGAEMSHVLHALSRGPLGAAPQPPGN